MASSLSSNIHSEYFGDDEKLKAALNTAPFFLLLDDLPRFDRRNCTDLKVEKGTIVEHEGFHDAEWQTVTGKRHGQERSGKRKHPHLCIFKSVESEKIKVQWEEGKFGGLSEVYKDLLLAVGSTKERFEIYTAAEQKLFACVELKENDLVWVHSSALSASLGTIRYKGPLYGKDEGCKVRGTSFGIELTSPVGSSNGSFMDHCYFKVKKDHAVFVAVNKLSPYTDIDKTRNPVAESKNVMVGEECRTSSLPNTCSDLTKPSVTKTSTHFRKGDSVKVYVLLTGFQCKKWVNGKVVHVASKGQENLLGVELNTLARSIVSSNTGGKYNGQLLFKAQRPCHTVTVPLGDVQPASQQNFDPTNVMQSMEDNATNMKNVTSKKAGNGKCSSMDSMDSSESKDGKIKSLYKHTKNYWTNKSDDKTNKSDDSQHQSPHTSTRDTGMSSSDREYRNTGNSTRGTGGEKKYPGHPMPRNEEYLSATPLGFGANIAGRIFGGRAQPPASPFTEKHFTEISRELEGELHTFANLFGMSNEWNDICAKEQNSYMRTSVLFNKWWYGLHEKHQESLQKCLKQFELCGHRDLADYIRGAHPFNSAEFDDTFLMAVVNRVGSRWKTLAHHLGLSTTDVEEKKHGSTPLDQQFLWILRTWQRQMKEEDKLGILITACRHGGFDDLADELEQGVTEELLKNIAGRIDRSISHTLGEMLGISNSKMSSFEKIYPLLWQRVLEMLKFWRMTQGFDVDKSGILASVLSTFGLDDLVADVNKGLKKEEIEKISLQIRGNWKRLAALLQLTPHEIQDINEGKEEKRAFQTLLKWTHKRRAKCEDLKEELCILLISAKLPEIAYLLSEGFDKRSVEQLAYKLAFDWIPVAGALKIPRDDISSLRDKEANPANAALKALKMWLEMSKYSSERGILLCSALTECSRQDIADWFTTHYFTTDEAKVPEDRMQEISNKKDEPRNLTKDLFIDLCEKINVKSTDLQDMLNITATDIAKYSMGSVESSGNDNVLVFETWFQKFRKEFNWTDLPKLLANILMEKDLKEAAEVIVPGISQVQQNEGSSVDARPDNNESSPMEVDLAENSMVEVDWAGKTHPGVIRWLGMMSSFKKEGRIAGIELDNFLEFGGTDGTFGKKYCFNCQHGKGLFVPLTRCRPDGRFLTEMETFTMPDKNSIEAFGGFACPDVPGYFDPPKKIESSFIGMERGIQGDHNSCYMDVTLYSMFAFSNTFDDILRTQDFGLTDDIKHIKDVLREKIVNPLRRNGFVRADKVLEFRGLLNDLSQQRGLTTEEKDPEEFLHVLLQELFHAQPFLNIRHGQNEKAEDSFFYQVFLDKTDIYELPTVEQLLHMSFLDNDLKLTQAPKCMIIQLPRYGKNFKMFEWILPSLVIDISDILENHPRSCVICGGLALYECKSCRPKEMKTDEGSVIMSYCQDCLKIRHKNKPDHKTNDLKIDQQFMIELNDMKQKNAPIDEFLTKKEMELSAFVCIETSHYVTFVRAGTGENAQWVFFDSMADRRGDQRGYNVPEVSHMHEFKRELENPKLLLEKLQNPQYPRHWKRLLGDGYICFYQSKDLTESISPSTRNDQEAAFQELFKQGVDSCYRDYPTRNPNKFTPQTESEEPMECESSPSRAQIQTSHGTALGEKIILRTPSDFSKPVGKFDEKLMCNPPRYPPAASSRYEYDARLYENMMDSQNLPLNNGQHMEKGINWDEHEGRTQGGSRSDSHKVLSEMQQGYTGSVSFKISNCHSVCDHETYHLNHNRQPSDPHYALPRTGKSADSEQCNQSSADNNERMEQASPVYEQIRYSTQGQKIDTGTSKPGGNEFRYTTDSTSHHVPHHICCRTDVHGEQNSIDHYFPSVENTQPGNSSIIEQEFNRNIQEQPSTGSTDTKDDPPRRNAFYEDNQL